MDDLHVIVWNHPNGVDYFDASTPESWAESSLEILRRMDEMGYHHLSTDFLEVEDIDVDSLPEPYRTEFINKSRSVHRHNSEITHANSIIESIIQLLQVHDTSLVERGATPVNLIPVAWELLQERKNDYHEWIQRERVWSVQKD